MHTASRACHSSSPHLTSSRLTLVPLRPPPPSHPPFTTFQYIAQLHSSRITQYGNHQGLIVSCQQPLQPPAARPCATDVPGGAGPFCKWKRRGEGSQESEPEPEGIGDQSMARTIGQRRSRQCANKRFRATTQPQRKPTKLPPRAIFDDDQEIYAAAAT